MSDTEPVELIYVADAMCSWCYGFSPVLARIIERHGEKAPLRIVQGGLRPGAHAVPVDSAMKTYLREHWQHVEERTGLQFDYAFFSETGRVYDTEPAAMACVAMRRVAPQYEFAYFHALQEAFYARNRDITQQAVLAEEGAAFVDAASGFDSLLTAEPVRQATHADYAMARRLGVRGFPTLLVGTGSEIHLAAAGYQSLEAVQARVDQLLA